MSTVSSGGVTPQEPEITATTQTIKPITWAPTAITGAVERTSELIRDYERRSFHLSDQMLTDLCALVDATRALLAQDERPEVVLPDDLRQGLNHAYAAAHLGVSWTPGNPGSTSGLSKDEALREASDFLVALYDRVLASESRKDGETP